MRQSRSTFTGAIRNTEKKLIEHIWNHWDSRLEQQHSGLAVSEKEISFAINQDRNCWTIAGLYAANEGFQRK